MRTRWVWLAFIVFVVVSILTRQHWAADLPSPVSVIMALQSNVSSLAQNREESSIESPQIIPERLLSDLRALEFERYSPVERAQARHYISQALTDAGWSVQRQIFAGGVNLYADRPGTDPNAGAILVGAHYDSVERSPGIDDNATGVAVVLEVARLLGAIPTPHPLKVVLFDLEEAGLLGSKAFVSEMEVESIDGALIMEMVGYSCDVAGCQQYPDRLPIPQPSDRGDFIAVIGDQGHARLIDAFQQPSSTFPSVFTLAIPVLGPIIPDLLRSDHVPFWQAGIGAVMVTDTANFRNPHYHQPTDRVDTINPDFLSGVAQRVVDAVTLLLNAPQG
ncbi:MAG TPA: M28 family peptidase [Elainellaceae cyanobacterium]